jgi:hypothetical protein
MKTLHNVKDWFSSCIKISVPASLSVTGKFSPMSIPHWMQNKPALFYKVHVLVDFRYDISVSVFMVKIAASKPLKMVNERIFGIRK